MSPDTNGSLVWVRQEHPNGCGVAAMAMVAGLDWQTALAEIQADDPTVLERGVYTGSASFDFLLRRGFYQRSVWRKRHPDDPWPPAPFAPVHIAQVTQSSGNGHWVVMDEDGAVFDPMTPYRKRLDDWAVVNQVTGFVRP